MEVHARHRYLSTQAPAPKKKKAAQPQPEWHARLATALDFKHNSKIVLACVGANDRRWDGSRPIPKAYVPEVACGYPQGTHEKKVGNGVGNTMFHNRTPSAKGVYTLDKVNYKKPGVDGRPSNYRQEKTGEVVHYRLVEESDVEAIKEAFPHLVF